MSEPRYLRLRISDLELLSHPRLSLLTDSALEHRLKQILRNVRSVKILQLGNEAGYEVLVREKP